MHECPNCGQACDCKGDIDDMKARLIRRMEECGWHLVDSPVGYKVQNLALWNPRIGNFMIGYADMHSTEQHMAIEPKED